MNDCKSTRTTWRAQLKLW